MSRSRNCYYSICQALYVRGSVPPSPATGTSVALFRYRGPRKRRARYHYNTIQTLQRSPAGTEAPEKEKVTVPNFYVEEGLGTATSCCRYFCGTIPVPRLPKKKGSVPLQHDTDTSEVSCRYRDSRDGKDYIPKARQGMRFNTSKIQMTAALNSDTVQFKQRVKHVRFNTGRM